LQGGTANLDKLNTWLEDIDKQFEARWALIDKLFEEKMKALEHYYAVECSKIPPAVLNSKILQANGKENSNIKTKMEGTFQEPDSTLHSRHCTRSHSAEVTSSIFSTDSHPVTHSSSLDSRHKRPKPMTSTTKRNILDSGFEVNICICSQSYNSQGVTENFCINLECCLKLRLRVKFKTLKCP
jgi:hypothetical protein